MKELELLRVLDSPLIDLMAPELIDLRVRTTAAARIDPEGCTPCQERERLTALIILQIELTNLIKSNPALEALVPQLMSSAKQVYDARKL